MFDNFSALGLHSVDTLHHALDTIDISLDEMQHTAQKLGKTTRLVVDATGREAEEVVGVAGKVLQLYTMFSVWNVAQIGGALASVGAGVSYIVTDFATFGKTSLVVA